MGEAFAKGSKPERDMTAEVKAIDAALFSTYEQYERYNKRSFHELSTLYHID